MYVEREIVKLLFFKYEFIYNKKSKERTIFFLMVRNFFLQLDIHETYTRAAKDAKVCEVFNEYIYLQIS